MADNVTFQAVTMATPAPGIIAATDEVQVNGTQPLAQVQYVKLVDGTPNGTGAIPGDSTNGLDVDVTRTVAPVAGTAARTQVPDAAADTQLLASNANRKMAIIVNDSDQDLFIGLGGVAVTVNNYSYFLPKVYGGQKSQMELPLPMFTGEIRGIWSANSTGQAVITELT